MSASLEGTTVHATYRLIFPQALWDMLDQVFEKAGQQSGDGGAAARDAKPMLDDVKQSFRTALDQMRVNTTIVDGRIATMDLGLTLSISVFTVDARAQAQLSYGARQAAPEMHGTQIV